MKENRRVLVVDDNKDIHDDFNKILIQDNTILSNINKLEKTLFDKKEEQYVDFSCELDHAYQGDEAILKVSKADVKGRPYALIFMDVRMPPGIDGIETIYRIWRKYPFIEVVICTAYSDYSWDEIITKLGTTDKLLFIKKPFNAMEIKQMTLSLIKKWNLGSHLNQLVENLEHEIKTRTEQLNSLLVQLREKNRMLEELSRRDSLTGLLNHAALYEQLNSNISGAKRHGYPLIIIMIDIDNFRQFNDNRGHPAGDAMLQKAATAIQKSLRLYDITLRYMDDDSEVLRDEIRKFKVAGRYGGDEFICIIPHCGTDGARDLAGRIHQKIRELRIAEAPGVGITASIGVCILDQDVRCPDNRKLIKLADKALSLSKGKGGDQVTCLNYKE